MDVRHAAFCIFVFIVPELSCSMFIKVSVHLQKIWLYFQKIQSGVFLGAFVVYHILCGINTFRFHGADFILIILRDQDLILQLIRERYSYL